MELKIVTIDIENFSNLLYSWQTYGQNWRAIETEVEWHIMSFAAKWLGEKTQVYSLNKYKNYKPFITRKNNSVTFTKQDERELLQELWNILDKADIVIGWNSKRFDIKKIQSKLIAYGFEPPSPFRQIDVMLEKKKVAESNSNALDYTGQEWNLGEKLPHTGWPLWKGCAEGDKKAWSKMCKYNAQDVVLTEKTYLYLRPWIANHPNLAVYEADAVCPKCKSRNLQKKGPEYRGQAIHQRWRCKDCGGNLYTNLKGKLPLRSA